MIGLIAALPIVFAGAGSDYDADRLIHRVGCRVFADGICVENRNSGGPRSVGGNGGNGGSANVIYNINIGAPRAGNGADGGGVTNTGLRSGGQPNDPGRPQAAISPPLSSALVRCTLTIAGRQEVDAAGCQYERIGNQIKLTAPSGNKKYVYSIKVKVNEDKTGDGFLSGGRTLALRDLGKFRPSGPCWISFDDSVQICAWK